jgi:hypothetical protein
VDKILKNTVQGPIFARKKICMNRDTVILTVTSAQKFKFNQILNNVKEWMHRFRTPNTLKSCYLKCFLLHLFIF